MGISDILLNILNTNYLNLNNICTQKLLQKILCTFFIA